MAQCHHARIMRPRAQLREDDLTLFGQEELDTPNAITCQRLGYLICHVLCLFQSLVGNLIRHPTLTIVATLLYMSDRRAENSWSILLGDGQQSKLTLEVDKLLNNDLFDVATSFLHGVTEGFFQLFIIVDIALAMTT